MVNRGGQRAAFALDVATAAVTAAGLAKVWPGNLWPAGRFLSHSRSRIMGWRGKHPTSANWSSWDRAEEAGS